MRLEDRDAMYNKQYVTIISQSSFIAIYLFSGTGRKGVTDAFHKIPEDNKKGSGYVGVLNKINHRIYFAQGAQTWLLQSVR